MSPRPAVLLTIALGGMLGAGARHALDLHVPAWVGFPWATFLANTSGCLLIGMLMVRLDGGGRAHPLTRPFLGVGLLGGYTTYSTYAVQASVMLIEERPILALVYLFSTLAAAMLAVVLGVLLARGLTHLPRRPARRRKARP